MTSGGATGGEEFLARPAGASARAQAEELAGDRSRGRRLLASMLDLPTNDRSWRRGAEGEELVGRKLEKLGAPTWRVVHDIPIGSRGANLDHLLIGPGGVFSINTKKLRGKITVTPNGVFQNGRQHRMVAKARAEAAKAQERLVAATGMADLQVTPMLVLVQSTIRDPEPRIRGCPDGVVVRFHEGLRLWFFRHRRATVLSPQQVLQVELAARLVGTWTDGTPKDEPASTSSVEAVEVTRWRRWGHDRLYVSVDGRGVGHRDLVTDELVVDAPMHEQLIRRVTSEWLARNELGGALGPSAPGHTRPGSEPTGDTD